MLNKAQLEELFRFCDKHCVRHYDVQCELVDHLANAIEERMAADERLGFEAALAQVYAGFGVMGFAGIVDSHAAVLAKQYNRNRYRLFGAFFTLPKIAFTLCILTLLWVLPAFFTMQQLSVFVAVLLVSGAVYEGVLVRIQFRTIKKQRKKLLLLQSGPAQAWFGSWFVLQAMYHYIFKNGKSIAPVEYYVLVTIAFLFILSWEAYRRASAEVLQRARLQYPEVFA